MAQFPKILAQAYVTGGQPQTGFYTNPAGASTVMSCVSICNMHSGWINVSLTTAITGEVDNPKQYILKESPIAPNDTTFVNIGITMSGLDVMRASISTTLGSGAFNIYGLHNV